MKTLINFILIILAAYGFAISVQMLRGKYLNFKPFNCLFCMSFWFSIVYFIIISLDISSVIINSLAIACIAYFISRVEDLVFTNKEVDDMIKGK